MDKTFKAECVRYTSRMSFAMKHHPVTLAVASGALSAIVP